MRIGIAILNWNGLNLLKSHLKGVVNKSEDCTIYIIDNNSNDDSLDFVKHNFPQVKLITLDKNYGFAEGYNIGLKHVNEDIVCYSQHEVMTNVWLKTKLKEKETVLFNPVLWTIKIRILWVPGASEFIDSLGIHFVEEEFSTLWEKYESILWW